MCGFVVNAHIQGVDQSDGRRALETMRHRGPDDEGEWYDQSSKCWLGHQRLSIIDLSQAGRQPFSDPSGRYHLVFNGEIYNYLELKEELNRHYPFSTSTDTEVLLAAYLNWGETCLPRLVGMFAFAIWDAKEQKLFAARDRFGVKPLFFSEHKCGGLQLASEIKALHALGVPRDPDEQTWCTYLRDRVYDHEESTFWKHIRRLMPGHLLRWTAGSTPVCATWYDLEETIRCAGIDARTDEQVGEDLEDILYEALLWRFRSDVPVGICLSGGLDSSLLFGLVRRHFLSGDDLQAFTFYCGDERYDETPWVEAMVRDTSVHVNYCLLSVGEVPSLAQAVQAVQDEPFGGLPTLGMAKVHQRARDLGVSVLLDGNGMDEGWAGYEYYDRAASVHNGQAPVQGTQSPSAENYVLKPEFARLTPVWEPTLPFNEPLLNLQYRDLVQAKIPRAMRFADRVSMMYSRELREPFLDHRLVELGLRQPQARKIRNHQGKWLIRRVAESLLPQHISEAPKRAVQTPQREWLRGPLAIWAEDCIETALSGWGANWLDASEAKQAWRNYRDNGADNSFPFWQWINMGLMQQR